jgi:prepilin-type processing-associated H-X9-DG protein
MENEESPTMTKRAVFSGALILAMSAAVFLQHGVNAACREENRLLRQRIAQWNAPDQANQQRVELQPAVVSSSAGDRAAELVRLRAEIESLKKELAERMQTAERDRSALAQAQAGQTAAETALKQTLWSTRNNLSDWGVAWTAYAGQNHGQFPVTFDQARPFLPDGVPIENDLVPSQFDIIYQGSMSNLDNSSQIVVLRQRNPVRTSGNANWLRTYLFADGHCEIQSTTDGSFEKWESQHTAANP